MNATVARMYVAQVTYATQDEPLAFNKYPQMAVVCVVSQRSCQCSRSRL